LFKKKIKYFKIYINMVKELLVIKEINQSMKFNINNLSINAALNQI
jgi:hypothetical protein